MRLTTDQLASSLSTALSAQQAQLQTLEEMAKATHVGAQLQIDQLFAQLLEVQRTQQAAVQQLQAAVRQLQLSYEAAPNEHLLRALQEMQPQASADTLRAAVRQLQLSYEAAPNEALDKKIEELRQGADRSDEVSALQKELAELKGQAGAAPVTAAPKPPPEAPPTPPAEAPLKPPPKPPPEAPPTPPAVPAATETAPADADVEVDPVEPEVGSFVDLWQRAQAFTAGPMGPGQQHTLAAALGVGAALLQNLSKL